MEAKDKKTKRKKQWGGHHLLSAKVRDLNLRQIDAMTEDQAYAAFQAVRFADSNGEPTCPRCKSPAYTFKSRKIFKCMKCGHRFSLTSGTHFHGRKLSYRDILYSIATYAIGAKGMSAVEYCQHINIGSKTAFVLRHRFREAVAKGADHSPLTGEVEFDCAEVGGYIRPKNIKKLQKDRRKFPYRSDSKLIVVVARERNGRAVTTVVNDHSTNGNDISDAAKFVEKAVSPTAIHYSDQGAEWSGLRRRDLRQVNHNYSYHTPYAHTNNAESYFSMLRRVQHGIYHCISSPRYLHAYTEELNFRQNMRRCTNMEKYNAILRSVVSLRRSSMTGYWQKHRPKAAS